MTTDTVHTRTMSLDRGELLQRLPSAVGFRDIQADSDHIVLHDARGPITIRCSGERTRRIGSLQLPVMLLEFHFSGQDNEQIEHFMSRFDLYFRRGGG